MNRRREKITKKKTKNREKAKAHRLAPFPGGKRGSRLRNPLVGVYFGPFSQRTGVGSNSQPLKSERRRR
jgi:hypothetical protein